MVNWKLLLASAFFWLLTAFFGWWMGGDLWADFQNSNAKLEPARELRITEAKCRSKLFVISFCDIKYSGPGVPGGSREISYLIAGGVGDASLSLQRVAGAGATAIRHVTTDYGMANLTNRIVSFGVLMLLLLAMSVGGIITAFRRQQIPS